MIDNRIQAFIDHAQAKWGLEYQYELKTTQLYRRVTLFEETIYTLSMEWFPKEAEPVEEGHNPEGTAVIEVDLHTGRYESVIFVGGKSYANGVTFQDRSKQSVIDWIEAETGLNMNKQFQHVKDFQFQECINGVPLSPSGSIEVKVDEAGKLTFLSVHGQHPPQERVKEEPYTLTLAAVEQIAKEQLKLIEFPSFEKQQLVPAFALEELYIRNDLSATIPFEFIQDEHAYLKIDQIVEWQSPLASKVERTPIFVNEELTVEQAFSREPHPDTYPITAKEQTEAINQVEKLLREEYAEDSGKWTVKTLHRDKGFLVATLRRAHTDEVAFKRKLAVFIDRDKLEVANYLDNKALIERIQDYPRRGEVRVTKDEAFRKIQSLLELTPVYVYDFASKEYVLCGKLDCHQAVLAESGEVVSLSEL